MKYPIITYKQMCKILKRNKYHFDRYSSDNAIYVKDGQHHISINRNYGFYSDEVAAKKQLCAKIYNY